MGRAFVVCRKSRVRLPPAARPNDFSDSNRPEYSHSVYSELVNSGIRVAVGDCAVIEHRRWRSRYQTGKTVICMQTHYKHDDDGRMVLGVCGHGSIPLSHLGNVVTRIGLHRLSLIVFWKFMFVQWIYVFIYYRT